MVEEEHYVYVKTNNGCFVILSSHADDILLAGFSLEMLNENKSWLSSIFEVKDMGEASYVIGKKY